MRVLHAVQQFIGTRTTAWAGPGLLWTAGSCAYGLSCLIASDGVGPLGWHAARVLLLLSLSVFTVLELSGGEGLFHARRILLILGYAAAARAPFDVLAVAPALAALGMARSDRDPVVVWRLAGLAAFLFVAKAYLVLPVGWYVGERVASLISGQVSALAPWRVQMGPSMLGLPGLAFYACSLLVAVPLLWRAAGGRRSLLAGAALLAMLFGGQVVARVAVPAFSSPTVYTVWAANLTAYTAMAICLWPLCRIRRTDVPPMRGVLPPWSAWAAAFVIPALAFALQRPAGAGGTVLILKDGAISWGLPDPPQVVGRLSDGKVGLIEHYLRSIGFRVRWHQGTITPSILRGADVLVTMNLSRHFDGRESKAVWTFVRKGGGLLVCGDHTDYAGLAEHYNRLLKPVGIRFNFDSAVPIAGAELWRAALGYRPSPLAHERTPVQASLSIGASLSTVPPAVPLVVGRYGFSDPGERSHPETGCLGNLTYDPGERLGDVVLAAAAQYSRGKVLVFGDTSSFMNYSLPSSYEFVGAVFRWLADNRTTVAPLWPVYMLAVALLAALVICKYSVPWHWAGAVAVMCALVPLCRPAAVPPPKTPMLAVVDVSHLAPLPLYPGPDSALAGMNRALMRRGYLPIVTPEWNRELVRRARLVILPGPARDFSASEVADLRELSARGGHLLACVGAESSWLTPNLLRYLGVQLEPIPLGSADGKRVSNISYEVPLHFVSAWPVYGAGYSTVYQAWGYPVVIGKYIGRSHVAVVGDSQFALGDNLEGDYSFYEGNLWLFNTLTEP
ncbi:MAG: hypothetical protein ACUVTZ_05005 [Armatimonadota bacterium]